MQCDPLRCNAHAMQWNAVECLGTQCHLKCNAVHMQCHMQLQCNAIQIAMHSNAMQFRCNGNADVYSMQCNLLQTAYAMQWYTISMQYPGNAFQWQCNEIRHSIFNVLQCNSIKFNAMRSPNSDCNAMQCSAMQCTAMHPNTFQYKTMACAGDKIFNVTPSPEIQPIPLEATIMD